MLYKAKTLERYKFQSLDGEIGKTKDFYFDDQHWAIRYLVADTGDWLTSRQILLSPRALGAVLEVESHIAVNLTKKQIEDSPSLASDKPVSRQFETEYNQYFGWPIYWSGPNMSGVYPSLWGSTPQALVNQEVGREPTQEQKSWNPNLRSAREVTGYHLHATDGDLGHIEDFIVDNETWAIRYLVADMRNWWPGKKVLISTQWIDRISFPDAKVFVNITRDTIQQSPAYTNDTLLTRVYEEELHRALDRVGYWAGDPAVYTHSR